MIESLGMLKLNRNAEDLLSLASTGLKSEVCLVLIFKQQLNLI